ncbi:MAG: secretin N-terminal domain-containing protein [Nitrospirota bacterium]
MTRPQTSCLSSVLYALCSLLCLLMLLSGCAHYDYALSKEGKELYESQEYETEEAIKEKAQPQKEVILEKRPPEAEKKVLEQEKKPEKLLSNIFFDTDIKEIIRNLSAETGENLITDDTVQGVLSVRYENLPLEKVLKIILSPGGYTFRKMDGYYLIGSADPRSPLFNYLSKTVYVKPKFLKAKEIIKLISPSFGPSIQVNEERNMLTITSSPEMVERVLEDIKRVDKMPKQVMLEALVTELSSDARKKLGIDWSGQSGKFSGSMQDLDITFTYISTPAITRQITAKIHALVEDGLASIKATPRVTTMDGEEAVINIGLEQYIALTTGPVTYPYTTVQTIKAGIILNIVPFISEDNTIMVKIKPAEVSDFVETGTEGLPLINKRSVNTTVVVKNNETIIIGGLIRKRDIDKISRVPVLGYIPILNIFFSKTEKTSEDSEVLIMITPRILETPIPVQESSPP